jgi:hypothetical protein
MKKWEDIKCRNDGVVIGKKMIGRNDEKVKR